MIKEKYRKVFQNQLEKIKFENRYRIFNELENFNSFPIVNWMNENTSKKTIVWCSNDYLGMSQNKEIKKVAIDSIKKYGIGSGGTRNISGTHQPIVKLEKRLASIHKKQNSLVFSSGYVANESSISAITNLFKNIIIFSDEKNHASIISGIKKNKCNKIIFRHNDMVDLEKKLSQFDIDNPKIIIFESVYSMDGSLGDIKKIVDLSKKYNCLTYVDEVHAVGIFGKNGGGISEELNLQNEIDIIQGTLAKAFGSIGGYIATDNLISDYIRSSSSGFIFTTSIPPLAAESALASIDYLKNNLNVKSKQIENVNLLKNLLFKKKINFINNNTHIIPVMINDAKLCKQISDVLLNDYGHYIQPINYPTVKKGEERLRITPGPLHTKEMIINLVDSLVKIFNQINLNKLNKIA